MTIGLVKALKKLEKILTEEELNILLDQITLHDRIELVRNQQLISEHESVQTAEGLAHNFALDTAGNRQSILVGILPQID